MTEIEFLHEMVKAAGGDPDKLNDRLKSTYYECLINCMKNGMGGNGGSTGGGSGVMLINVSPLGEPTPGEEIECECDKTYDEIMAAFSEGKLLIALLGGAVHLSFIMFDGDTFSFCLDQASEGMNVTYGLVISSAGAVMTLNVQALGAKIYDLAVDEKTSDISLSVVTVEEIIGHMQMGGVAYLRTPSGHLMNVTYAESDKIYVQLYRDVESVVYEIDSSGKATAHVSSYNSK